MVDPKSSTESKKKIVYYLDLSKMKKLDPKLGLNDQKNTSENKLQYFWMQGIMCA